MIYVCYYLFVYGISYYLVNYFPEVIKDKILTQMTFNPTAFKATEWWLYCQLCQAFWIGWIAQYFVFGVILPYYAFGCFGLVATFNLIFKK